MKERQRSGVRIPPTPVTKGVPLPFFLLAPPQPRPVLKTKGKEGGGEETTDAEIFPQRALWPLPDRRIGGEKPWVRYYPLMLWFS